jgi:hypothetical protein
MMNRSIKNALGFKEQVRAAGEEAMNKVASYGLIIATAPDGRSTVNTGGTADYYRARGYRVRSATTEERVAWEKDMRKTAADQ